VTTMKQAASGVEVCQQSRGVQAKEPGKTLLSVWQGWPCTHNLQVQGSHLSQLWEAGTPEGGLQKGKEAAVREESKASYKGQLQAREESASPGRRVVG